jgi:outer membrane protein, heavy metal efflux system
MLRPKVLITLIGVLVGFLVGPLAILAYSFESQKGNPSIVALSALIEEAQGRNPEILAMKQRLEVAKAQVDQDRSLDDPQLTLTQKDIPSDFNLGDADETWYGIGQNFPFPGKLSLRGKIAAKASEAVEQDYLAKVREMTARVKLAYYRLFLIQKSIELYLEHQALLEVFIQIADQKYAVGQASQQDLLKAQVEFSKLHNSLLVLEQERDSVQAEINALLDRPPGMAIGPVEELVVHPFTFTLEDLRQQALEMRPELKAAKLLIERSEQARSLARKNYLPDFMVEVMYWDGHTDADKWMTVGKINLPWVFKGKYDARVRQVAAEEAQARADQTVIHNQTLFELRDLFTKIKMVEQLIAIYQNGVLPQAEQSLAAARIGYQAGKVGFLDLIDSERTLLDFQLEYFGALFQFWQSVAKLERTVGNELNI